MKYTFTTATHREGKWYVAVCIELGVTSQGKTAVEARANLKEAVELYLEDVPSSEIPRKASTVGSLEVNHV